MTSKLSRIYLPALLLALLFAGGLAAETIVLKNGQVLSGRVVGQSRTEIRLQTSAGLRVIKKADIRRISYDTPADVERRRREEAERQERARKQREQEEAARKRQEQAQNGAEAARKQQEPAGETQPDEALSYTGFAVRNAVLPGWGFFANDQPVWGATYAALTAGALYHAWTTRRAALAARDDNFAQVEFNTLLTLAPLEIDNGVRLGFGILSNQAAFGPYQSKLDAHNQSLQILGLVYFAQLAHTAALAPGWPTPGTVSLRLPDSDTRLQLGLVGAGHGFQNAATLPPTPVIGAGLLMRF